MVTFQERRQLAREAGERIAEEAITAHPFFTEELTAVIDTILTECDGFTIDGQSVYYTVRLAAYHALQAKLARLIGE